jgi:uncharacterized protein (TIGR00290 family)
MFTEDGERSRSHGLPLSVIRQQAKALEVPLFIRNTSWNNYEENFLSALHKLKQKGIQWGVFGDIDLEAHLAWVERVCFSAGVGSYEPLWKRSREELLKEFLGLGFTAKIVAVKQGSLDTRFLGQTLNKEIIAEMKEIGIDPSGEKGEYHTVVTDGPLFSFPIRLESKGQILRDGYYFLDVTAV